MKLEDAWLKIMEMENSERFTPNQIHSILSDLGIFKANPRIRLVIKSALAHNLWNLVCKSIISSSEIHLLKNKLDYDGFSLETINELISSFYIDKKEGQCQASNIRYKDKKDNKSTELNKATQGNKLMFMGVALGSSLSEFKKVIGSTYQLYNRYIGVARENYIGYTGSFACIKNCEIKIFFDKNTEKVYKICITSKNIFNRNIEYKKSLEIYTLKYGTPDEKSTIGPTTGKVVLVTNTYRISDDLFIEIKKNDTSLSIIYCCDSLQNEAKVSLKVLKEEERIKELKNSLSQI